MIPFWDDVLCILTVNLNLVSDNELFSLLIMLLQDFWSFLISFTDFEKHWTGLLFNEGLFFLFLVWTDSTFLLSWIPDLFLLNATFLLWFLFLVKMRLKAPRNCKHKKYSTDKKNIKTQHDEWPLSKTWKTFNGTRAGWKSMQQGLTICFVWNPILKAIEMAS